MSKELADRTKKSLEKALVTARLAENKIDEVRYTLELLVGKLADIQLTVFNAWVFLVVPENMADALRHISEEDLKQSFDKCTDETMEKIKRVLGA